MRFTLSRSRRDRNEIPAAVPGSNAFTTGGQWGAIDLPSFSPATIMGIPAASRARNLIANSVAAMSPMELWLPDGFIADEAPNLLTRPNATWTTFDFVEMMVSQTIMHGNFLGLLADYDETGWPQQIAPVPWGVWRAYIDQAGYLVYVVNGETYSNDQVLHLRTGTTPNQPMGIGVVTQFRRALGQQLDQQNYTADTYRSGSVPAGIIKLDNPEIDVEQAEAVTSQWIEHHAGGRAPAVLPNTMTFEALQWSPEDMEFLGARSFAVAEIAFMFDLDPTDLSTSVGSSSTLTYANIEQRQVSRITDTYAPWMRRVEEAFSDCIPEGVAKLVPENLLRTDTKTRAEVVGLNIANKTLTADEARKVEGRRPLPKEELPEPIPAQEALEDEQ